MNVFIILLFALSRFFSIVIANFASAIDKYNDGFQFRFQLYHNNPLIPKFLIKFANFDGAQYLRIAHDGYGHFQSAFFPLFPLLIRIASPLFGGGYFLTGMFISNACFLLGLFVFKNYLRTIGKDTPTITWILLFLVSFPTSFFFMSVYTESVFFLLFVTTLLVAQKKRYFLVIPFAILTSLTRLVGVFLFVPLVTIIVFQQNKLKIPIHDAEKAGKEILAFVKKHWVSTCIAFSSLVGLLLYILYLNSTAHDALAFYHTQYVFGPQRSTHLILLPQVYVRYIKIFLTSQHTFIYFVSILEFVVFNVFLFVLCYDFLHLLRSKNEKYRLSLIGLNLFSFCNLLLPTFAGSLSSLPRYSLFSLSFFLRIAAIKNVYVKLCILAVFTVLQGILLWFFIQGNFIS